MFLPFHLMSSLGAATGSCGFADRRLCAHLGPARVGGQMHHVAAFGNFSRSY